ncbi:MAG TPA: RIP metalloprotease RseP [Burkholderiaceae bacterium]|nr:RIP metalloprotease RseP [Burkholderiaceae bacterium]
MNILHTVAAFAVALGVLIVVHELGHYLVARWCDVKVLRFSIGFGKPLWARRFGRDQTELAISMIPLGGYVAMLDEREAAPDHPIDPRDLPRAFNRQHVRKRIAIVLAGPAANLLLAIALYTGLNSMGVEEPVARLAAPAVDTPAARAGFRDGDRIVAVDGTPVRSWTDARWLLLQAVLDERSTRVGVEGMHGASRELVLDAQGLQTNDDPEADALAGLGLALHRPMPVLGRVEPGSPAERAGLREGDRVVSVNGIYTDNAALFVDAIRASPGRQITIDVVRNGQPLHVLAVPNAVEQRDDGRTSNARAIGKLGVAIGGRLDTVVVKYSLIDSVSNAVQRTWEMSIFSVRMLGKMLIGQLSIKHLSGPVTIADYAGQTARLGIDAYVSFVALISISLGVLNLLPIPMLDGGHLLYYLAEVLRGKPLSDRIMMLGQRAGLTVLVTMMAIALFNDFTRLLT